MENALARLIRTRRDETGWSYGDIARRGGLPKSTVHKLATTAEWSAPPLTATLDRLATGLSVPSSVVREAAAEAAGLTHVEVNETDAGTRIIIGSLGDLTSEQRRQVVALIQAMLNQ